MDQLLATASVGISELKVNPGAVIEASEGMPVAVLNRNKPVAYLVPAGAWELICDRLEDVELARLVEKRRNGPTVPVSIDDL